MQIYLIFGVALLLLLSVVASKFSDRFGVPALLLFLLLGMLAGSEGIGGIYFDNPAQAQTISVVALVLILFAGGLQTNWQEVRPVMTESFALATIGVLLTALVVGFFANFILGWSLLESILLGSIMSSTDAAAVFSVLRSKGISLKGKLKPLLELESGSNDPMAMFLTIGLIELLMLPESSLIQLGWFFLQQMVIGGLLGYFMGRLIAVVFNRIRLEYEGLYPVLSLAFVLITFAFATILNGSGFLAVYLVGVVLNHIDIVHKRSLQRFHDGIAWLMQITMFLVLGLFVFPSKLIPLMGASLLIVLVLIFLARPLGVFLTLLPSRLSLREKTFISWVGLRGAAPIILATFPLLAGVPQADMMFNMIFFIVLTSVLLQGTTIPFVAHWLNMDAPKPIKRIYPIEYQPLSGLKSNLLEVFIPKDSSVVNKAIVELRLPDQFLIILVARKNEFLIPFGSMVLKAEDTLLVLSDEESLNEVLNRFNLKTL